MNEAFNILGLGFLLLPFFLLAIFTITYPLLVVTANIRGIYYLCNLDKIKVNTTFSQPSKFYKYKLLWYKSNQHNGEITEDGRWFDFMFTLGFVKSNFFELTPKAQRLIIMGNIMLIDSYFIGYLIINLIGYLWPK